MTPDTLSEKYYGVSPYAFCNNNPVNLVDPDGRTWINKQKQIVCDANGPTVYATSEEVELIKAMNSIKTGRQQLQKLIDAPFDVQVIVGHDDSLKHYGKVPMTVVNVHSGYSDKGNYNSRGSQGCITIHPNDAESFF